MAAGIDKIIYDALLEEGKVKKEQLDLAMDIAGKSAQPFAIVLVKDRLAPEKEILDIMGKGLGISCVNIKGLSIDKSITYKVPLKIATYYNFMPIKIENGVLTVAVHYPMDVKIQDEIRTHVGYNIDLVFSPIDDIHDMLKLYYGVGADTIQKITTKPAGGQKAENRLAEEKIEDISKITDETSVMKLVNQIIVDAYKKRASDIHIEPYREKIKLRYRIDGVLYSEPVPPEIKPLFNAILSRIKIMSNLNIVEHRLPQDGRAVVKVQGQTLDLRISSIPTPHGEGVVIRILPTTMLFSLKDLGLGGEHYKMFENLINIPHGIIFITGPTGSGKTTTLYTCLSMINTDQSKIITLEDPIEYEIEGITQIQVLSEIGLTFAQGLRSVLRHDPDVIMVGEVRDLETAEISIRTALTGHLVFSTLHTNDAPSGITRLIDIGVEPYLIASSVEAFIAQRLARLICQKCKEVDNSVPKEVRMQIAKDLRLHSADMVIYKGKGCDACNHSGFYGRIAIYEILLLDDTIKELILKKTPASIIKKLAMQRGMRTLRQDGWQKVINGVTTPDEVMNITPVDDYAAENGAEDSLSNRIIEQIPQSFGGTQNPDTAEGIETSSNLHQLKEQDKPADNSDGDDSQAERRTYVRLNAKVNVIYKTVVARRTLIKRQGPVSKFGVTDNISAGGLMLKSDEPIPIGSFVELRIELPDTGAPLMCLGKVLRVKKREEDKAYNVVVTFLDLSSAERERMNKYVEEELKM